MKIKLIAGIKGVYLGYLFGEDTVITVGREIGNTIAPIVDNLSRHHAKIYFRDGDWYAEDCGSTNGSYINGKKLEGAQKLVTNDMLRFGLVDIQIELVKDEAEPAKMAPIAAEPPPAAPASPIAPVKPVAPISPVKPASPIAPVKPIIPAKPAAPVAPAAPAAESEMTPVDDIPELTPEEMAEPVAAPAAPAPAPAPAAAPEAAPAAEKPASPITPVKPVIHKPVIGGGFKPGLKLPPKPGLAGGLKLPPRPGAAAGGLKPGLKLPPKSGLAGGLKPGLKLPPKPGLKK